MRRVVILPDWLKILISGRRALRPGEMVTAMDRVAWEQKPRLYRRRSLSVSS